MSENIHLLIKQILCIAAGSGCMAGLVVYLFLAKYMFEIWYRWHDEDYWRKRR